MLFPSFFFVNIPASLEHLSHFHRYVIRISYNDLKTLIRHCFAVYANQHAQLEEERSANDTF